MHKKQNKAAKVAAGVVGFAMAFSFVFGGAVSPAQAITVAELQAQIAALTAQLNTLAGNTSASTGYTFTTNLTVGSRSEAVKQLQIMLNASADTQVAASGAGSKGNETTFFGPATRAAVIKFQTKNGITPAAGYVGPVTRAKLNETSAATGGTTTTPPPTSTTPPASTGTGLSVSSGSQPSASLAPESAARLPFTRVMVTASADGDITLNSFTVERVGLANDAVFGGVVLLDENGNQIGIAKTLNSNHQTTVGEAIVVPRGTTKTFTIAGNMSASLDSYAGQVVGLNVVGVNTSATVSGSLPISGAAHTVNATLSIGSITNQRGPLDPNGAQSKEVGTTGYTFSSVKITAGSAEKVRLNSIRWNQSGSAASSDLANVKVYVDGTAYETTISSDGKYYTANFGGILIDKGLSKEISIKGDVVGGSGRTIAFDLYKTTDLNISGETFGYGITPPTSGTGFASTNPWYDASVVTVSNGSITVEKATSVTAQNVAINLSNQPLGGFTVDVKGESISVASIVFNVAIGSDTAAADVDDLTNVTLVDQNGAVVAGPVDGSTGSTDAIGTITFTDTVTFPIGKGTYTIKGKLGTDFTSDLTVSASTTPSSQWTSVTGQVTGNSITPSPSSAVTSNTMTVKAASITISVSTNPPAQTVVSGASQFTFANYQLDASASGEDIRFTSIPLEYNSGGDTATNLTNCTLYDGSTALNSGSNVVNPSAAGSSTTFTLDTGLTVPKGTTKTVALKCNIAAGATGSYAFGYDSSSSPSATGLTSGQSATITENDSMGQLMTLTSGGSLTLTKDASSPSYKLVAAGTTGNIVGVLKLRATNEAINLTKLSLQLTNTASSSASDLTQVTLWDGVTQVGTATFVGSSSNATSTISGLQIPKDTDKLLTIKADFASIGTSQVGVQGHLIAVDFDGDDSTGTQGTGVSSGTTISEGSSDTAMDGVRLFKSFPTVAKLTVPTNTLSNGQMSLLRFRVTADAAGDVGLSKFTLRISTTTASVTSLNIYAYTDSGFSSVVSGLSSAGQILATDILASGNSTWVTSATDLELYAQTSGAASTTIQVPAGQSRYFDVVGTVAGATTGASVSTQLQGDAAYPALSTFMATAANVDADTGGNDDFIWSPNATTSSVVTAVDWTNGYGVSGLPGTNMSAEVLSR